MLAVAVGAISWNVSVAARTKMELDELGVEVWTAPSGLEADPSRRFKPDNLSRIVSLLGKLTALHTLNLTATRVDDIGPLKALTALHDLYLTNTQVADLEPLKGLTALQVLSLSGTHAPDLGPLKALTALHDLYLTNTQVADLEPLKGLTALHVLDLSGTQVADLEPLKGLTALQSQRRHSSLRPRGPLRVRNESPLAAVPGPEP